MENYLDRLFEYQSFEHNERLDAMIKDTENRADFEIVDEELLDLVAGGVKVEDMTGFTDILNISDAD